MPVEPKENTESAPSIEAEREEGPASAKVERRESPEAKFSVQAVRMALFDASDLSTSKCFDEESANAYGRVQVTFAPDGTVAEAKFLSEERLSAEVQGCVLEIFGRQTIPAFSGLPKTVEKRVPTTREAKASFLAMVLGCEGAPIERYAAEHGVRGVPEERDSSWVGDSLLESTSCKLGAEDHVNACVVVVGGVAKGAWVMSPSLEESATWCLTAELLDASYPSDAGSNVVRLAR